MKSAHGVWLTFTWSKRKSTCMKYFRASAVIFLRGNGMRCLFFPFCYCCETAVLVSGKQAQQNWKQMELSRWQRPPLAFTNIIFQYWIWNSITCRVGHNHQCQSPHLTLFGSLLIHYVVCSDKLIHWKWKKREILCVITGSLVTLIFLELYVMQVYCWDHIG